MSTRDFTIAAKQDLNIFSFVKITAIFLYQYSLIRRRNYYICRYCFNSKPKFLHACVKYCLTVAMLCFSNNVYHWLSCDPVETLTITSKQVQNLSKFANKNKSSGIFYQYYKYEYYND